MKSKNFHKHLTLNKKTIANLNNGEMHGVHGGGDSLGTICCNPTDKSLCNCPTDPSLVCPATNDTCRTNCECATEGCN
jgi:hypothetical protein